MRWDGAVARDVICMVNSPTVPFIARDLQSRIGALRAAGATVAHVRVLAPHRRLYRSVLPMEPVYAHGGIIES